MVNDLEKAGAIKVISGKCYQIDVSLRVLCCTFLTEFIEPVSRKLQFFVKNEPGALVKALKVFGVSYVISKIKTSYT